MISFSQGNGDRIYKLQNCVVKLTAKSLALLKDWDNKYPTIIYDSKYLKQLAMDIFGPDILAISSVFGNPSRSALVRHQALDPERLEFLLGIVCVN